MKRAFTYVSGESSFYLYTFHYIAWFIHTGGKKTLCPARGIIPQKIPCS